MGPLYHPRYVFFSTPALALLVALAIARITLRHSSVVIVGVLVFASIPTYLGQRHEFSKYGGSDLRQVASTIAAESSPGDAIILTNTGTAPLRPRHALYAYPDAFEGLQDVAFLAPFTTTRTFSDKTADLELIRDNLNDIRTLWVVTRGAELSKTAQTDASLLADAGFTPVDHFTSHRSLITKYER
jgi:mannosyltransferase